LTSKEEGGEKAKRGHRGRKKGRRRRREGYKKAERGRKEGRRRRKEGEERATRRRKEGEERSDLWFSIWKSCVPRLFIDSLACSIILAACL